MCRPQDSQDQTQLWVPKAYPANLRWRAAIFKMRGDQHIFCGSDLQFLFQPTHTNLLETNIVCLNQIPAKPAKGSRARGFLCFDHGHKPRWFGPTPSGCLTSYHKNIGAYWVHQASACETTLKYTVYLKKHENYAQSQQPLLVKQAALQWMLRW